jgi:hypothetical protein
VQQFILTFFTSPQAIRKACDELTVHVQAMSTELSEKIDRESVGFIVHEKYEEIVRYLQDALQSSLEDENNFKAKADEIQEMVINLSNSKADRSEISNMQELMVKSEALLKKVGAQANIKERLKEFVSRKEVEAWLMNKVDKAEFEAAQAAAGANRRTRATKGGGLPAVDDAINKLPQLTAPGSNMQGGYGQSPGGGGYNMTPGGGGAAGGANIYNQQGSNNQGQYNNNNAYGQQSPHQQQQNQYQQQGQGQQQGQQQFQGSLPSVNNNNNYNNSNNNNNNNYNNAGGMATGQDIMVRFITSKILIFIIDSDI